MQGLDSTMGDVVVGVGAITTSSQEIAIRGGRSLPPHRATGGQSRRDRRRHRRSDDHGERTAEGANQARELVAVAKTDAEGSGAIVKQAVDAMSRIEKSSQDIGQIIGAIDEIAFQTNLLALNAGIRGGARRRSRPRLCGWSPPKCGRWRSGRRSRQGDQGAGQHLDERGRNRGRSRRRYRQGARRIVAQVMQINKVVNEIAQGASEQASAMQQVNVAVSQMDQDTQKNAAMVEETTAASHSLRQEAECVAGSAGRFRISGAGAGAAPARTREPARAAARPAHESHGPRRRGAAAGARGGAGRLDGVLKLSGAGVSPRRRP